ncbi:hypothetical protein CEE37_13005 [candidate division LCP-89 bacterium B3_LCP]|uniref:Uncharacterized protein n=1 Tax=candidate division LCP-89 bacterium B3_LCP TaxID=2012998 RepID=A0A532UU40_UNCL8|nr:MAG: hypothetical protein CEE37_13005 [candidate division LCP-89 bacterium B3_LCP]
MTEKNVGWILIGFAIVVGALRLFDIIDNSITAVFIVLGFIMITGGLMGAKKKRKEKEKASQKAASRPTDREE